MNMPESRAQRWPIEEAEKENPLNTKERPGHIPAVTPGLESRIVSLRGDGQPLDPATRTFLEPRFGQDLRQVRLHTDSKVTDTAQAVEAKAFTLGRDIVFGAGQYTPETTKGKHLIAYELVHVGQQSRSRLSSSSLVQRHAADKQDKEQQGQPASHVSVVLPTDFIDRHTSFRCNDIESC